MRGRNLIIVSIVLIVALGMPWFHVGTAQGQGGTCAALVTRALSDIGTNCAGLGANGLCYGFAEVTATLVDGAEQPANFFATPGYQTELSLINTISTGPFSSANGLWGLAVMNVQAGTKSASANQSTVYLLMGDAQITNLVPPADTRGAKKTAMAPMQDILLSTGPDSTECFEVPPSALIVQSPTNAAVMVRVNGVEVELSSTVIFRAPAEGQLQVITGNGSAVVLPNSPARVTVPAGVSLNLVTSGDEVTWQNWRIMSGDEWERFGQIENVPGNVFRVQYANPSIVLASGAGGPQPQVQLPTGITRPTPPTGRPFPLIVMASGRQGRDLGAPAWSPITVGEAAFSDVVVFHTNRDDNWELYTLDLVTGATANITRQAINADIEPSVSPDGQWVAFISNRDPQGSWEVYISRIDGSDVRRVTYNSGVEVNPVWGPDGRIVFESNRDGNWELYMVDVAGDGVPVRLTEDEGYDIGAFWLPDGEHIVFESDRDGDWEIFKLNVLTGDLEQLTDNEAKDQQPVVSHDGSKMVWLQTDDNGIDNLWMMDLTTGDTEQLTDSGYSVSGHVISPDDTFVVFSAPDDGGDSEIVALELASGLLKALTANAVDDRAPTFVNSNSQVIYQSVVNDTPGRPGQYELFQVNPLPLDGPANTPVRLTVQPEADDIYAVNDPRSEANSRPNLLLPFPVR